MKTSSSKLIGLLIIVLFVGSVFTRLFPNNALIIGLFSGIIFALLFAREILK